jgi:hypothetical protein
MLYAEYAIGIFRVQRHYLGHALCIFDMVVIRPSRRKDVVSESYQLKSETGEQTERLYGMGEQMLATRFNI